MKLRWVIISWPEEPNSSEVSFPGKVVLWLVPFIKSPCGLRIPCKDKNIFSFNTIETQDRICLQSAWVWHHYRVKPTHSHSPLVVKYVHNRPKQQQQQPVGSVLITWDLPVHRRIHICQCPFISLSERDRASLHVPIWMEFLWLWVHFWWNSGGWSFASSSTTAINAAWSHRGNMAVQVTVESPVSCRHK